MEPEVYIVGDQPTTCPKCGARTDFSEMEKEQQHICLNESCGKQFIVTEDSDFDDGSLD